MRQDCNYRHITDTINTLSGAVREVNPDAQPDPVKALQAITLAVRVRVKICPSLSRRSTESRQVSSAGFFQITRSRIAPTGKTSLPVCSPEHRGTTAERDLSEAFVGWCFGMGASEVRGYLLNSENAERFARAATRYGWETQGTIIVRKRGG
jgi:hypothetical protein